MESATSSERPWTVNFVLGGAPKLVLHSSVNYPPLPSKFKEKRVDSDGKLNI